MNMRKNTQSAIYFICLLLAISSPSIRCNSVKHFSNQEHTNIAQGIKNKIQNSNRIIKTSSPQISDIIQSAQNVHTEASHPTVQLAPKNVQTITQKLQNAPLKKTDNTNTKTQLENHIQNHIQKNLKDNSAASKPVEQGKPEDKLVVKTENTIKSSESSDSNKHPKLSTEDLTNVKTFLLLQQSQKQLEQQVLSAKNIQCTNNNCMPPYGSCSNPTTCFCFASYANFVPAGSPAPRHFCSYERKLQITAFFLEFFIPSAGHFYLGRIVFALVKLFTMLSGSIFSCIAICCMSKEDAGGCRLFLLVLAGLCGCAFSIWQFVDAIIFICNGYPDGNGIDLKPW